MKSKCYRKFGIKYTLFNVFIDIINVNLRIYLNLKLNNPTSTQMFLYSALDWGLGHTTRSISILNKIKENNTKIYIACEPESPSEKF